MIFFFLSLRNNEQQSDRKLEANFLKGSGKKGDRWSEQTAVRQTVRYSETESLASCIVSRQAGLTQGLELHAVPVISPPSGRVG